MNRQALGLKRRVDVVVQVDGPRHRARIVERQPNRTAAPDRECGGKMPQQCHVRISPRPPCERVVHRHGDRHPADDDERDSSGDGDVDTRQQRRQHADGADTAGDEHRPAGNH
jgi:hypothetical protein